MQYLAGIWTDNGAAEHDAGDRPAADRLRRPDANRPAATRAVLGAMLDDRGAVRAGRVRFRAALRRHRDGALGVGAVHLLPVLTGAALTITLLPTISGPPPDARRRIRARGEPLAPNPDHLRDPRGGVVRLSRRHRRLVGRA